MRVNVTPRWTHTHRDPVDPQISRSEFMWSSRDYIRSNHFMATIHPSGSKLPSKSGSRRRRGRRREVTSTMTASTRTRTMKKLSPKQEQSLKRSKSKFATGNESRGRMCGWPSNGSQAIREQCHVDTTRTSVRSTRVAAPTL